jgi:hypothetical protein
MKDGRALFYREHIGGNQYRLRIQNHQAFNLKQWFIFDRRTITIRPETKRNYAISNQRGQRFLRGRIAVVRKWDGEAYQRTAFYGGARKNIRNVAGLCLDVHGASNTHNRHVTFWDCHNGLNQGWTIDTQGVKYNRYPIADGKRFQIRSRMKSGKAIRWHEHIGGNQFRLRIQNNNPYDVRQWWIFDWRTKSIRSASDRKKAIGI